MTTLNDGRWARQKLSQRETLAQFSLYAFGIAALWGAIYLGFFLLGAPRP